MKYLNHKQHIHVDYPKTSPKQYKDSAKRTVCGQKQDVLTKILSKKFGAATNQMLWLDWVRIDVQIPKQIPIFFKYFFQSNLPKLKYYSQ